MVTSSLQKLKDKWRNSGTVKRFLKMPRVSGFVIFATFSCVVILNLMVMLYHTHQTVHEERLASSDEIITHLVNTLYLLQISPQTEWPRIAKISQTPDLSVSLSPIPKWPLQLADKSLSQTNHVLQEIPDELAVSFKLDDGTWLNVNYTPHSNVQILQIFIICLGLVAALALLFSAWSMWRFTYPLKRFKAAAEQLGLKLRSEPIIEYGPAIVRETADAMNQMQSRISSLLQDRNRMLAAISHDLRTPITRLKLRAQFLEDPDEYQEVIADLDEMEAMIDQILTYTRDASKTDRLTDLDLPALLMALCDQKSEQGHEVECEAHDARVAFKGRPLALKRAFTNLLNNAVKYANKVEVNIHRRDQQLIITIEDDGPGIPEKDLDKVFTPFYRVDQARSSMTGGSGLGLAIVQDVIHDHNGSIQLSNRDAGGLRVEVILQLSE